MGEKGYFHLTQICIERKRNLVNISEFTLDVKEERIDIRLLMYDIFHTHLPEGSWVLEEFVDEVTRDPDERTEAEDPATSLSPSRVHISLVVCQRRMEHDGKDHHGLKREIWDYLEHF